MGIEGEVMHFTDSAEIKHFAEVKVSKNDNVYGVGWANLVKDYLKTAYMGGAADAEIVSWGATYKVLKRENVTVFYDKDGNTLFDVENKRLEKEYEYLMGSSTGDAEEKSPGAAIPAMAGNRAANVQAVRPVKQQAEEKLKKDMAAAKDKSFAEPIIGYLLKRCKEDEGLAEDVVQEHKTWEKCIGYIYGQAKKQSEGNCAAIREEVVYEWAEDYYHKDDKAEEEKNAREEAERKEKLKKKAERVSKEKKKPAKAVPVQGKEKKKPAKAAPAREKEEGKPQGQEKPKKNSRDMDGQLDMFSLMGM